MKNKLILDSHSDFIEFTLDKNIHIDSDKLMFNIKDSYEHRPYIEFTSIFIDTKYLNENSDGGYIRAMELINKFENEYLLFKEKYNLEKIISSATLNDVITKNKIGLLLTLENMAAIGTNISRIEELYNRGIKIMSLTWNDNNLLASGAKTTNDVGITEFGRKCIDKMNELNIILDVSHLSKNSFKQLITLEQKNVIATHCCVKSLCNNIRNLDDYEIKYIAKQKGVIGICFFNKFLTDKRNYATIDDIIDNITYIANLVGINYVGLGSDFDGIKKENLPIGLKGIKDLDNLIDRLITRGFSTYEIEKIMGFNFYNYIKKFV
jgi:membrane dipeptidase